MSNPEHATIDYGIIIQARAGSSRLTNKVMRPFYDKKGILQIMIERLLSEAPDLPLIVATTTATADEHIFDMTVSLGAKAFRGSEEDVLQRFVDAAHHFSIRNIVRICSDNPFLDVASIRSLVDQHRQYRTDYLSYEVGYGLPAILSHIGIYPEIVTLEAMEKEQLLTNDLSIRQHVTYYIYKHPEKFEVKFLPAPLSYEKLTGLRLTVDTSADFTLAQQLYEKFDNNSWSPEQLIDYVRRSPEIMKKMKNLIEENPK